MIQPELPLAPPPAPESATTTWLVDCVLLPAYRPLIPDQTVWQWADRHVYLDNKAARTPSYYNSARTPHARQFQETFTDPRWREDLALKSSRSGYTEGALNGLRFMPQHMPGHVLFAIDSMLEIKAIKEDRIAKTLEEAAGDEYPDDEDKDTTTRVFLNNMTVYLSGSYSPGIFRNKWLRVAILDEIEVNSQIADEGNTLDLAESRLKTDAGDGKLFAMSKPKKPGTAFHKRWCSGTRSVFLAPCPHCGTHQELTFFGRSATDHLKPIPKKDEPPLTGWPDGIPLGRVRYEHCRRPSGEWDRQRIKTDTYYQCVNGCRIRESDTFTPADLAHALVADSLTDEVRDLIRAGETVTHKRGMILSGRWLATNPDPYPGRRSRHISDLYSLYDDLAWGELALLWSDSEGDSEKEMHFYNNNLGLTFVPRIVKIDEKLVLELRHPGYRRGQCPFRPDLVLLNWDTQMAHYSCIVTAWLVDGTCAVIDWFDAMHDNDVLARLNQKIPVLRDPIHPQPPLPLGHPLLLEVTPHYGMGDAAGYPGRTDDVYDLCLKAPGRLYASFGRGRLQVTTPISERKITYRMQDFYFYFFSDDTFKRKLYIDRIGQAVAIKQAQKENKDPTKHNLPARLYLPSDADSILTTELSGERMLPDGSWEFPAPGPNHKGDALKNAFVQFENLLPRLKATKAAEEAAAAKTPK